MTKKCTIRSLSVREDKSITPKTTRFHAHGPFKNNEYLRHGSRAHDREVKSSGGKGKRMGILYTCKRIEDIAVNLTFTGIVIARYHYGNCIVITLN